MPENKLEFSIKGFFNKFSEADKFEFKFESNFLREYDPDSYPSDSYEPVEDLICTHNQLETFMKTIEGCTYRLKQ